MALSLVICVTMANLLLAAQSADTMTHPAFRNRGLFVKLAGMTVDLCRRTQIAFAFWFPQPAFITGFCK
jgi:hypothetical protein